VLGLESLELRRLRTDILLTYKILYGIIDVDVSRSLFVLGYDLMTDLRAVIAISCCKNIV